MHNHIWHFILSLTNKLHCLLYCFYNLAARRELSMAINISTPAVGNVTITLEELKSQQSAHQSLTENVSKLETAKSIMALAAGLEPNGTPLETPDLSQVAQQDQIEEVAEDNSSEVDSDLDPDATLEQPTLSERRRIQNLKFNSLLVTWDQEFGYQPLMYE